MYIYQHPSQRARTIETLNLNLNPPPGSRVWGLGFRGFGFGGVSDFEMYRGVGGVGAYGLRFSGISGLFSSKG